MKNIKILKTSFILFFIFLIVFTINNVYAVTINSQNKVDVGQRIDITLDFGTNVAAYDSLEVTYNSMVLNYISDNPLTEKFWYDTSYESNGIRKKTYSFITKGNGKSTINIKLKGVVSANYNMDELGDFNLTKTIIIGTGIKKGDLNGDGVINSIDAALTLDLYNNGTTNPEDIEVADMNNDGVVNSIDAAIILDMYNNGD